VTEVRLFCLPYAGGAAQQLYGRWGRQLPDGVRVVPLDPPGHGARMAEPLPTSVEALAKDAMSAILSQVDGPYALFGHSLGALVAYEAARRLEHLHRCPPVHLFVSGHAAPQTPREPYGVHELPDDEFIARIREFSGTPEEVFAGDGLRETVLPILRADLAASDSYRYRAGPRLSCRMTVFGGLDDTDAPVDTLALWNIQTSGFATVRVLPDGHFFLHSEEAALLAHIADNLTRTRSASPGEA